MHACVCACVCEKDRQTLTEGALHYIPLLGSCLQEFTIGGIAKSHIDVATHPSQGPEHFSAPSTADLLEGVSSTASSAPILVSLSSTRSMEMTLPRSPTICVLLNLTLSPRSSSDWTLSSADRVHCLSWKCLLLFWAIRAPGSLPHLQDL